MGNRRLAQAARRSACGHHRPLSPLLPESVVHDLAEPLLAAETTFGGFLMPVRLAAAFKKAKSLCVLESSSQEIGIEGIKIICSRWRRLPRYPT